MNYDGAYVRKVALNTFSSCFTLKPFSCFERKCKVLTCTAGQDSLTPPAPAGRVLMVCQSSLNNCSGKLKQGIYWNVYFRELPAGGKWVVIKQEQWRLKEKLHIMKLRSLWDKVSETWEFFMSLGTEKWKRIISIALNSLDYRAMQWGERHRK